MHKRKRNEKLKEYYIMIINKKKITYITVTLGLFVIAVTGAIFVSNNHQVMAFSEKPAAGRLKEMATDAYFTNENKAKALFETTKRQYEYVLETTTDYAIHNFAQQEIIDCEAQLWMLENA